MLTTRDALAVIGAIALLRLAWTTLRARFGARHRPRLLPPEPRSPQPPATGVPVVDSDLLRVIHGVDPRDFATWPGPRLPGEPPC